MVLPFLKKYIFDQWIHANLNLPQGDLLQKANVGSRTKDGNGDAIGSHDHNPFLKTLLYDVNFSDGEIKEHSANVMAENIHSQMDEDFVKTKKNCIL